MIAIHYYFRRGKLLATYNELQKLGAPQNELDILLPWLRWKHAGSMNYFQEPITPVDILESNGIDFLSWVTSHIDEWWEAWERRSTPLPLEWARSMATGKALIFANFLESIDSTDLVPKEDLKKVMKEGHTKRVEKE